MSVINIIKGIAEVVVEMTTITLTSATKLAKSKEDPKFVIAGVLTIVLSMAIMIPLAVIIGVSIGVWNVAKRNWNSGESKNENVQVYRS